MQPTIEDLDHNLAEICRELDRLTGRAMQPETELSKTPPWATATTREDAGLDEIPLRRMDEF